MSASYFLSPHVHVCVAGKQVVLLDLERDKYLSLARAHPVGRWVRGWPVPYDSAPADSPDQPENSLIAKMIAQGLLVADPTKGKEAAPVVARQPRIAVVEYDLNARPRTDGAQLWNLMWAYAAAKWSLRHRPIKAVVEAARLRRSRAHSAAAARFPDSRSSSGLAADITTVRPLVTAFFHLRPWFYTARNACLLDSLTLVNFLARYGVFPEWVFGVKTDPFYAHCWVQQGEYVFNDTADYVRGFSPILVV
jgi:hypothetical protein